MSDDTRPRIRLGARATALAERLTGNVTSEGLEAAVIALEEQLVSDKPSKDFREVDSSIASHLVAVHDSLATIQLMLLASASANNSELEKTLARFSAFSERRQSEVLERDKMTSPMLEKLAAKTFEREAIEQSRTKENPIEKTKGGHQR